MLWFDNGATIAFWIILCSNAFIWFSIAKLNGGRFMDGYKPGFPFYLLYSRPVPTFVFVGVTVVYDALSGVVLYLVSAALVGFAFGQPLPLFSVIPWIVASRLGYCLHPMVDPKQNRPVGRIAGDLSAVVHSAPASRGVAAAGRTLNH